MSSDVGFQIRGNHSGQTITRMSLTADLQGRIQEYQKKGVGKICGCALLAKEFHISKNRNLAKSRGDVCATHDP